MDKTVSDKQLIGQCLAEDQAAREQFVVRFSRLVYSTIMGSVKAKGAYLSELDVEDLHNSVFVSLFDNRCRKLCQYEGRNGCSLASWVRMITVRAVLDHLRRGSDALARPERLATLEMICEPSEDPRDSPWACLVAKEQQTLIQEGLERLSDRDRLVIQMHCLEEQPLARVALILGVSEANIHSVKHRAVQRLKAAVGELTKRKPGPARKN